MIDAPDRPPERPNDDDVALVGEYVLGLLDRDDAAALERRLSQEPRLRALHAEWAADLATLLGTEEKVPPARLKRQIEARLFPHESRRGWAGWGAIVGVPVAALAAAFFLLQPADPFDPTLHVDLAAPQAGLLVAAGADEDTLRIILQEGAAAPGRSLELWLIAGDADPVSLGLVPESGQIDIPRPEGLDVGVVFAVSDEPEGGSPTGQPTGEILAAEPLFEI
ncbi:anti-sigma factor [uncultured Jannaschia sp.]|uniref:anti-sigma factor n=1 Tax=uncultured Jannaschia sp. TaxID=293347 RepID=UPI00262E79B6|nr:anti-sigma factor [uncultured Jannaschia sp.]